MIFRLIVRITPYLNRALVPIILAGVAGCLSTKAPIPKPTTVESTKGEIDEGASAPAAPDPAEPADASVQFQRGGK